MNGIQHFSKLIKDIKFAMFTTVDTLNGSLHSRPMTLQQAEFDGDLWFFANRMSEMVRQIEHNNRVNLAFSNFKDMSFLSAQGRAEILNNEEKEKELWNPLFKAWFPKGLEDPDLCLIKVSVEGADFWESPHSSLIRFAGFAKNILTGKRADSSLGTHGHLNLG